MMDFYVFINAHQRSFIAPFLHSRGIILPLYHPLPAPASTSYNSDTSFRSGLLTGLTTCTGKTQGTKKHSPLRPSAER